MLHTIVRAARTRRGAAPAGDGLGEREMWQFVSCDPSRLNPPHADQRAVNYHEDRRTFDYEPLLKIPFFGIPSWLQIARRAQWRNPGDVKAAYPKASVLKSGSCSTSRETTFGWSRRCNIEPASSPSDFFGAHREYDAIDAETV